MACECRAEFFASVGVRKLGGPVGYHVLSLGPQPRVMWVRAVGAGGRGGGGALRCMQRIVQSRPNLYKPENVCYVFAAEKRRACPSSDRASDRKSSPHAKKGTFKLLPAPRAASEASPPASATVFPMLEVGPLNVHVVASPCPGLGKVFGARRAGQHVCARSCRARRGTRARPARRGEKSCAVRTRGSAQAVAATLPTKPTSIKRKPKESYFRML